jgi:solute carrier family 25 protein 42
MIKQAQKKHVQIEEHALEQVEISFEEFAELVGKLKKKSEQADRSLDSLIRTWIETDDLSDEAAAVYSRRIVPPKLSVAQSLIVGGISGGIAKTAIAPLDRIKILFQVNPNKVFTFSSAYADASAISKNEGFRALWRGNGAMMVRVVPYAAIQYAAFDHLRQWTEARKGNNNPQLTSSERFILGSTAGAVSVALTYPLDLLRARYAVQTGSDAYRSLIHAYQMIVKNEGFNALFRGMSITLFGIVPYAGLSFGTFETMKMMFLKREKKEKLSSFERLVSGAAAGFIAQTITYPIDVVRRRLQVSNIPQSAWTVAKNIYFKEGVLLGFYKGLSVNWIKGPIALGISFSSYDFLSGFIPKKTAEETNFPPSL